MVPRWLLIVGPFVFMVLPVSAGVAVAQEPDLQALLTEGVAVHKSDLETIDGVETHRVDFMPNAAAKGAMVERLANSIAGSFWLTVDCNYLVRWQTRLTRPLKRGLIKMKQMDLKVTCQPVDDHYFAAEVEMESVVDLGFGGERKRNRYRYFEFEKSVPGG